MTANPQAPPRARDDRVAAAGLLGDVTLRSGSSLPADARAAVSGWLVNRVPASVVADAQLLISELATNSHLHSGGVADAAVRVRGGLDPASVWLEVGDDGDDGAVARRIPSHDGTGGYGLHLVEVLASQWGVGHEVGTRVWFRLALPVV
jgi:serine/threonine-protein kinase RsbW